MTIAKATDQIWRFPVKIQNPLDKLVQVQVQWNQLERVTWPPPQGPKPYWLYQGLQARYENYVSRFLFPSKFGSRTTLNKTNQRRSPDLLSDIPDHIGCMKGYRPDIKILYPDSCSAQQCYEYWKFLVIFSSVPLYIYSQLGILGIISI